jgi:hypothetical protein
MLNGVPVIFSSEAQLMEGGHRITSIIVSGTECVVPVVIGVDPACFTTYDDNKVRKLRHAMQVSGLTNDSLRQSVVNMLHEYQSDTLMARHNAAPDPKTGLGVVRHFGARLDEALWFVKAFHKGKDGVSLPKFSPARAAFAYAIFSEIDKPAAVQYLYCMMTGIGLKRGGPVTKTRNMWANVVKKEQTRYVEDHHLYALLFWGWNAFCSRDESKTIRLSSNGEWDDGKPRYTIPALKKPTQKRKIQIDRWFYGNRKTGEPGFADTEFDEGIAKARQRAHDSFARARQRARDEDGSNCNALREKLRFKMKSEGLWTEDQAGDE